MKLNLTALSLLVLLVSTAMAASDSAKAPASLEDQLKSLDDSTQLPVNASHDKMYSVQPRYSPLRFRSEFSFGGAQDLTPDSFLKTQQVELAYRFHFNDKWSLGLAQAWVDNELKGDSQNIQSVGALPYVPYASTRTDLTVEYNLFYGKFRWTSDSVSYFDMYTAMGPVVVSQNTGSTTGGVLDLGFAFWLGKWGSARFGLKDYAYNEVYQSGTLLQQNIHAHVDLGILY